MYLVCLCVVCAWHVCMCMPDVCGSGWYVVYTHCVHGVCMGCMYIYTHIYNTYVHIPHALYAHMCCVHGVHCVGGVCTVCCVQQAHCLRMSRRVARSSPGPVLQGPLPISLSRPLCVWRGDWSLTRPSAEVPGQRRAWLTPQGLQFCSSKSPRPVLSPEVSAVGRVLLPSP